MEEIRRAAGAYYEHLPEKDKNLAGKTFKAMDKNGDEQISLREYMKYVKKKKATDFTHESIFSALDKDENGSLDFEEAIVLYYVMQSGRAIICKSCKTFMPGAYFSCCQCFFRVDVKSTYEICCDCYGGKKFTHHDGATFCDNFTLLRQSRSAIQAAPMTMRRKVLKAIEKGLVLALIAKGLVEIYGKVNEVIFGDDGCDDGCDDGGGGCGGDGSGGSGAGGCDDGGGDGGGAGGGGAGGGGGCDDGDGDGDCSIM